MSNRAMRDSSDPARYEAWYHTPRGNWIGDREFTLLRDLAGTEAGVSLLDVGCGTGYFARRFARSGVAVTGIDTDSETLEFAIRQGGDVCYLQASALALPFPDNTFDCAIAVTSLCFIDAPLLAAREIWRVSRHAVVLGLLNRNSLLYRRKKGQGGYFGARWDTAAEVTKKWIPALSPAPGETILRSAIFFPHGTTGAQRAEQWLPGALLWGGFLAVGMRKS